LRLSLTVELIGWWRFRYRRMRLEWTIYVRVLEERAPLADLLEAAVSLGATSLEGSARLLSDDEVRPGVMVMMI
jgi:hypothetical protein